MKLGNGYNPNKFLTKLGKDRVPIYHNTYNSEKHPGDQKGGGNMWSVLLLLNKVK